MAGAGPHDSLQQAKTWKEEDAGKVGNSLGELTVAVAGLLEMYGLVAIFLVMLLKETGIPIPVPSDLIVLLAGAQAASGRLVLWEVFLALLLAMIVGAWVQYRLVRSAGRSFLRRWGRFLGLTEERLERIGAR